MVSSASIRDMAWFWRGAMTAVLFLFISLLLVFLCDSFLSFTVVLFLITFVLYRAYQRCARNGARLTPREDVPITPGGKRSKTTAPKATPKAGSKAKGKKSGTSRVATTVSAYQSGDKVVLLLNGFSNLPTSHEHGGSGSAVPAAATAGVSCTSASESIAPSISAVSAASHPSS